MRQSDIRSAKFGELFETLRDDPDRDQIIGIPLNVRTKLNDNTRGSFGNQHS